jgi:hypothetical protein
MSVEPSSPPRFIVRQGTRDLMVWDRERKGPAMFNGHQATVLSEWQAKQIKDQAYEILRRIRIVPDSGRIGRQAKMGTQ